VSLVRKLNAYELIFASSHARRVSAIPPAILRLNSRYGTTTRPLQELPTQREDCCQELWALRSVRRLRIVRNFVCCGRPVFLSAGNCARSEKITAVDFCRVQRLGETNRDYRCSFFRTLDGFGIFLDGFCRGGLVRSPVDAMDATSATRQSFARREMEIPDARAMKRVRSALNCRCASAAVANRFDFRHDERVDNFRGPPL